MFYKLSSTSEINVVNKFPLMLFIFSTVIDINQINATSNFKMPV